MKAGPGQSRRIRVQKYLSHAGAASRREAEELMRQGRVAVNGVPVTVMGSLVTPGVDAVSLDGRPVEIGPRHWLVLHKPAGVLCTRRDPHGGRTVYDVLPGWAKGLRYVGRLDRETSGLLLMTNDGDLAALLAHPRAGVEREYVAQVEEPVTARTLRALRRGVELDDGWARPRAVRKGHPRGGQAAGSTLRIVLAEGRKREVRRLIRAVGNEVTALERTRFGPFQLGRLAPGAWRPARTAEIEEARRQTSSSSRGRSRRSPPRRASNRRPRGRP